MVQDGRALAPPGDRRPKRARHINLSDDQYAALELISARLLGRPTISSLIRAAIDDFVRRQVEADPSIEAELQAARVGSENVVPIRPAKVKE
jgi:hypothetical protein